MRQTVLSVGLGMLTLLWQHPARAQIGIQWDDDQIDWEDYSCGMIADKDKAANSLPAFGKAFQGFALKISTTETEFEQETPVRIQIDLRNANRGGSLLPPPAEPAKRVYALHVILTNKHSKATLFSKNLLDGNDVISTGRIPGEQETPLGPCQFDTLEVARVEEFLDGLPYFDPKRGFAPAGQLQPQLYTMKAALISALENAQRPDFVIASESWRVLLRPKRVERMSEPERQQKLDYCMTRLQEGAHGGMAVADQLAALKEVAVDALIETAATPGTGATAQKTMESRVWSIAILCNTESAKAAEFIRNSLEHPVAPDDLAFLAWHSQRLRDPKITETLLDLARKITKGEALPWETRFGKVNMGKRTSFLGWTFRHLGRVQRSIPDDMAEACLAFDEPRIASLALDLWAPSTPNRLVRAVRPFFTTVDTHPNLKRATLRKLAATFGAAGFPAFNRHADPQASWCQAAVWLRQHAHLTQEQLLAAFRNQIIFARTPQQQRDLIAAFRDWAGPAYPVHRETTVLPDDWIATWQWCLQTGDFTPKQAVQFLCAQMRTREELDGKLKRALLVALKEQLGSEFPLASPQEIDLDRDWPACGAWLVDQGYFGARR